MNKTTSCRNFAKRNVANYPESPPTGTKRYSKQLSLLSLVLLLACNQQPGASDTPPPTPNTPVSVTTISTEPMASYLNLNATSSYLRKETIQAPIAGYIRQNNVIIGQRVKRGGTLFTVQTKEASALQADPDSK